MMKKQVFNDLVSIIVPVYNVREYVERCIDSILNQTYENIEIIIINDGSIDDSLNIVKKKYSNNEKVKIFSQENMGLSEARNTGIKNSAGDYLCFVDSDDWVSPKFVELLYYSVARNNADIGICNIEYIYSDGTTQKNPKIQTNITIDTETAIHDLILREPFGSHAYNKIYKASLFKNYNIYYPKGRICEDVFTTYRLIIKSNCINLIPDVLYFYLQQRPGSILNNNFKIKRFTDVLDAYNNFYRDVNAKFPYRDNSDFIVWKIDMVLGFYTILAEQKKNIDSVEFKHVVSMIRNESKNIKIRNIKASRINKIRFLFANLAPGIYCRLLFFLKNRDKLKR